MPPVDTLEILNDLYDSGILFGISTFRGGSLHVQMGRMTTQETKPPHPVKHAETNTSDFTEAVVWLRNKAVERYPDTAFAEKYGQ